MDAFGLSLERPWALLLLLLLVPAAIYLSRTSMALMRQGRRRWSLALRVTLILLLVFAFAGLGVVRAAERLSVVFLVDGSDSIPSQGSALAAGYINSALDTMQEGDTAGVVMFGADALVDRPISPSKAPPDLASKPIATYSNIEEAVRLAMSLLPSDSARRIVLISDGKENLGSAEWAGRLAGANGVPVDVVAVPAESGPEVWLEGMSAPSPVREGERVALEVSVASSTDTTATLSIFMDGLPLTSQPVTLVRGSNKFVQPLPPATRGFHTYSATLEAPAASDTRRENNRYSAFSMVLGKPSLLIVEGKEGEAAPLRAALAPNIDSALVTPEAMPQDVAALAGYDGIILVNVPASRLARTGMENLQTVVRELGKGLVVIGGDESYAAGGYFRTPLEEMLPIDLQLPSKLNIPTVAMVMVIDRSGSMMSPHSGNVGVAKIELAKEGAAQAVAQLSERDYAGVVTFDTGADWVVELQPLGDPQMFKNRIGSIPGGGGTNIYAGLSPAVDALIGSRAKSKHIVLLTDGVSEPGDYDSLLAKMGENSITLSTVAVGIDADTNLMQYLAQEGKGNYYYTEDGNALPQIFAHESHIASRSYLIEHPFVPERTSPSEILDGLGGLPALQGYVGTSPKPGGQIALVSDAGDPVLAQWQYGLGRVVAWTSDAKGQWAREWVAWADFGRFWGQAVRWATGTEAGGALQPRITLEGGTARITVDATAPDGQYLNSLDVTAVVVSPTSITSTVILRQVAAGRYEGEFPTDEEGAYLVRVGARSEEAGTNLSQTLGVVVPYSPEYRGDATDDGLMQRLAALTSGRVLSFAEPAAVFEHNLEGVRTTTELWPLLLLLSILLLPFDIGVRRVRISRADIAEWAEEARRRLGVAPRKAVAVGGGRSATPEMAAMMSAKTRVRDKQGTYIPKATITSAGPDSPQAAEPQVPIWVGELEGHGRASRLTQVEQVPTEPPLSAPPSAGETSNQDASEESLATRLRKARERR